MTHSIWLKKKKKSRNTTKWHNIFTILLFLDVTVPNLIFYNFILEKCYIHNIFTINFRWKNITGFKLGLLLISLFYSSIIPCHLGFAVKLLWKYCELSISFYFILFWSIRNWDLNNCKNIVTVTRCCNIFTIHLFSVVVGLSLIFYYFILSCKELTRQ